MQRSFPNEIFLLQAISKDFQSPPLLLIFLLDWDEFPLAIPVTGVDRKKEFGIPSQSLKYSDPFLEASTSLHQSFCYLNIWRLIRDKKNLFTSLRAYGNISRESWVGISLKNTYIYILNIYHCTYYFSGISSFFACCCFCTFFAAANDVACLTGGLSEWVDFHLKYL